MEFNQIIKELKNKIYKPIYILMGKEAYYIDIISDYIADNVLEEHEKDFNQTIFYGKDCDITTVIHTCQRYPMMSNYQVVIIKEAQNLKKFEDQLINYLANPLNTTILVVCFKYDIIKKRTLTDIAEKKGVLFNSKEITEGKLPAWIEQYVSERGYSIDTKSAFILAQNLGTDLSKIANEIDKLFIAIGSDTKKITPDDIEKNIGISKDYNQFELQNAMGKKEIVKITKMLNYFINNEKSFPFVVLNMALFQFFEKILRFHSLKDRSQNSIASTLMVPPFVANSFIEYARFYPLQKTLKIISLIREYDLKAKGVDNVSASDGQLLKEIIFKILYL